MDVVPLFNVRLMRPVSKEIETQTGKGVKRKTTDCDVLGLSVHKNTIAINRTDLEAEQG